MALVRSPGGALVVRGVDRNAQEDAHSIAWTGPAELVVSLPPLARIRVPLTCLGAADPKTMTLRSDAAFTLFWSAVRIEAGGEGQADCTIR